ncbi:DMT family transporter [Coralliovum pocilloporae]|uniref:DMT family transporter n=1 Tax=Coralliovum pocilloporae TaxID=3066369 RepID=UPI0033078F98
MNREKAAGHGAMLLFSALVAFSFTFGKLVATDIEPAVITLFRFVIAALTMTALAVFWRNDLSRLKRNLWRWLLVGGCMAAYFILMFEALRLTTSLATSAVFTLTPLMAALFGWLFMAIPVGRMTLVALLTGAAGALWVIFRGDLDKALALDIGQGEALFFLGAVAHAVVPALTRRLCPGSTAYEAAFGTVLGALAVTMAYTVLTAQAVDPGSLSVAVWWVALYLGIVTTAGTSVLLQIAIPRIAPGKVMAYTYLVPSWVVLHELVMGQAAFGPLYIGVLITLVALGLLLFTDKLG